MPSVWKVSLRAHAWVAAQQRLQDCLVCHHLSLPLLLLLLEGWALTGLHCQWMRF
jgi:hypothetical protein